MSSAFSGALGPKRRAELVEIAEELKLDAEGKISELKDRIQQYLDKNETTLSASPKFKGLYGRKRHIESESETPSGEAKAAAKAARKSLGKAVERTINAANIPLPDTPIAQRVSEAATNASQALVQVPAQARKDLTVQLRNVSSDVTKFVYRGQDRVDAGLKVARQFLSTPQNLILAFLGTEILHLVLHVTQSYNHVIFFPPPAGSKGTFDSLLHSAFFWLPKMQFTLRVPEWANWYYTSPVWAALSWWFFSTVLPAAAGATVISFAPQPTVHRTRQATRYRIPPIDPLSFALFRAALLLWSLTSAAPSSMVDALEMSGNLQGRALGAGLLAVLIFVHHFSV